MYLSAQVSYCDELSQYVLRQYIGQACLSQAISAHIDVISPQVQVSSTDSSHTPVSFAAECLLLIL
jgi:hypothetical protein